MIVSVPKVGERIEPAANRMKSMHLDQGEHDGPGSDPCQTEIHGRRHPGIPYQFQKKHRKTGFPVLPLRMVSSARFNSAITMARSIEHFPRIREISLSPISRALMRKCSTVTS